MDMMIESGFNSIFIGIETPSTESLIECGKSQNLKRNLVESVLKLQEKGFIVSGGFIVGFDSDTPNVFQEQIDFIQKSGIVSAMVDCSTHQAEPSFLKNCKLKTGFLMSSAGIIWMAK